MRRTDCRLAELLVGDLVGNVGAHQHTHGDTQLVHDHVGDEFETISALLNALQGDRRGVTNGPFEKDEGVAVDLTLIREIPTASLFILPFMVSHTLPMNWCGITNTKMSASRDASTRSGTAS